MERHGGEERDGGESGGASTLKRQSEAGCVPPVLPHPKWPRLAEPHNACSTV